MNYDHSFHAGNPADVLKHVALVLALQELKRREEPLVYLETHAGAGRYDLADEGEWRFGVAKLQSRSVRRRLPELRGYLEAVDAGPAYPGSPALAEGLLGRGDAMELFELHAGACERLRRVVGRGAPRVTVHDRDGYTGLDRLALDGNDRLLVLVDPPFERGDDWDRLRASVLRAATKRPAATLLVWFPVKPGAPHEGQPERLCDALRQGGVRGAQVIYEPAGGLLPPKRPEAQRARAPLAGSGLLWVNPVGRMVAKMASAMPELGRALAHREHAASFAARWASFG